MLRVSEYVSEASCRVLMRVMAYSIFVNNSGMGICLSPVGIYLLFMT